MKAFLLAAGLGTRLRPLTNDIPKCLLPICGRPLLDIWFEVLERSGVGEVLINTHHLAGLVQEFVTAYRGPLGVTLAHEPELLGSAGTLVAQRAFIENETAFLVCNSDNLVDFDLRSLVAAHDPAKTEATVVLFRAERPHEAGIVELDGQGVITSFVEKPANPASDLANAGLYVFSPSVLDMAPLARPADIGYDLMPRLVGRARGVEIDGTLLDIGTPDRYRKAKAYWREKMSRDHH